MNIPFSPPYIDNSVVAEVCDTLRSGWITTGPKVKALEAEIERLTGVGRALCVNSWTSGAIMTLRWIGLKEGDEVIIPAYTYCATALAVLWAGGKPVMADSGDDLNISAEAIRRAITPRTKAVIPVDIAGWPCDYDAIMQVVNEPEVVAMFRPESDVQRRIGRIMVVNDSAHSIGSRYGGRPSGPQTDVSIFSLHAVKNITTAEGGAICLNLPAPFSNNEVYAELRLKSLNCQTKDAFTKSKAGGWRYDIVGMGMKTNMADVNAAIGLAQIREYDRMLAERRRVFHTYNELLGRCPWAILPPMEQQGRETSYHVYPLRIHAISELHRDAIIQEVARAGVAVNVHFIPLPLLTLFRQMGYRIDDYPQAYTNYAHEISLPCYPQLSDEQVRTVAESVIAAYQKVISNE